MTKVITVRATNDRFSGYYSSEFNGICCPSLQRARGRRAMWELCHVCWKPLRRGSVYLWRNHVFHAGCGSEPEADLVGSRR